MSELQVVLVGESEYLESGILDLGTREVSGLDGRTKMLRHGVMVRLVC